LYSKNNFNLIGNIKTLNFFFIVKYILTFNSFFLFYFNYFKIINSLSFFKKIYLNLNFFKLFNVLNSKKQYLFYYIYFKKQNSLLKKKYNYINNLNPLFFKKELKKKIEKKSNNSFLINILEKQKFLHLIEKKKTYSSFYNLMNGKKKLKKIILSNRRYYNFLNFFNLKNSFKLTKNILIKSKQNLNLNIVNFEYSLVNILLRSGLFKSYLDIKFLLSKNYIYLNRNIIKNSKLILEQNDLIELNISYKFFNYIFFFRSLLLKNISKIKSKLWFRLRNRNLTDFNSSIFINRVFKNINSFNLIVPNYLEIDYFTLSLFIVYKNLNILNINPNIKKILVVYLFKLYNWR